MQTTKAMRDRIRELATPERDDFDRAVNLLLDDFEASQMFDLGNGEAVNCNPAGRFHGWLFRRRPDGQWFSVRKLDTVANPAGPLAAVFTA